MNGYIVGLMIILGIIIVLLICLAIVQYRFTLKYKIVPIPKKQNVLGTGISIPDDCETTPFFSGSTYTEKSIEEIAYAYF